MLFTFLYHSEYICLFCLIQLLSGPLSPNESFLRYLTLPQDNELAIDLRQTAVVVMAHLDRLATPCMPPLCSSPTSHKVCTKVTFLSFLAVLGIEPLGRPGKCFLAELYPAPSAS